MLPVFVGGWMRTSLPWHASSHSHAHLPCMMPRPEAESLPTLAVGRTIRMEPLVMSGACRCRAGVRPGPSPLACVSHAQAPKAVMVIGPQVKPYRAIEQAVRLADAAQYATACLPNAKVKCDTSAGAPSLRLHETSESECAVWIRCDRFCPSHGTG